VTKTLEEILAALEGLDPLMDRLADERVEVALWSTEPSAIDATRATIEAIGGRLVDQDNRFFLLGGTQLLDYVQWAALRQGYVKGLVEKIGGE